MPLTSGSRLGPYEIVAPLGAGGMGEVWRARDPRLGREVAVKILPEVFTADPERLSGGRSLLVFDQNGSRWGNARVLDLAKRELTDIAPSAPTPSGPATETASSSAAGKSENPAGRSTCRRPTAR